MRPLIVLIAFLLPIATGAVNAASPPLSEAPPPTASAASEVSPDELGALVSPIAFVDACLSLRDVSSEMAGAKPLEVAFFRVAEEFCKGMIVAVASTVHAGQPYRADGERICVDPELSADKVIDHIKGQIAKDPQLFVGRPVPQVETPAAIRRSIQALSPCR